jgi:hypothetical protein
LSEELPTTPSELYTTEASESAKRAKADKSVADPDKPVDLKALAAAAKQESNNEGEANVSAA